MKLLVLTLCVAVCSGARLDNTYLPPGSARTAGGSGNFLAAPHHGAPQQAHAAHNPEHSTPILRLDNENNPDGSYHYAYETGNRIQAHEAGQQKQLGAESVNAVHGSYSYTGDDGQQYTVTYIADENGFQPQGAHLPTPPPIPEAILKSLEQTARGGNDGNYNSGSHGAGPVQPSFNANSGYHY